jgi:hypothetical protein
VQGLFNAHFVRLPVSRALCLDTHDESCGASSLVTLIKINYVRYRIVTCRPATFAAPPVFSIAVIEAAA